MNLKHRAPASLVGRTIIHRNQGWKVDAVDPKAKEVRLSRWHNDERGLLRFDQLSACRLYPTHEEAAASYPLLKRALMQSCLLTHSEAESCLVGYLTTGPFFYGAEALSRIGGAGEAIRHAIRLRRNASRQKT